MNYIECPTKLQPNHINTIFLGGSISNAGLWQSKMVKLLDNTDLTVVNPRRANFDINNKQMTIDQIEWEFEHLRKCEAILFWFSYETVAPITLFEYGVHLGQAALNADYGYHSKKIFCGVHPEYQRKIDVVTQTDLINKYHPYNVNIVYSLESLAEQVVFWSENK